MIRSSAKPDRIYIGSSVHIMRRWNEHLRCLKNNNHYSLKLQNHYNKYNKSDLSFSIILTCDKDELISNEQFFIDAYKPYFNNRPIADSPLGFKLSKEAKLKISESNRRRKITQETKDRIRRANTGKIRSIESRGKQSANSKGRHFSEEHKQKLSEASKGRIFSEEHRENMSKARINRVITDETKRKLSESHKGEKNSFYGKHHTDETKRKIRESRGEISIEERKLMSERAKNRPPRSAETLKKMSDIMIKLMDSPEERAKHSMIAKRVNHKRWHTGNFEDCVICNKELLYLSELSIN